MARQIVVQVGNEQIRLVGRLAQIVRYVVTRRVRLQLDSSEYGRLHVTWAGRRIKGTIEHDLDPDQED